MEFQTIQNNPDMGLNNTICVQKDYFCKRHKVFMSKEDVAMKKCLKKATFDMMSTYQCPYIVKVTEENKDGLR